MARVRLKRATWRCAPDTSGAMRQGTSCWSDRGQEPAVNIVSQNGYGGTRVVVVNQIENGGVVPTIRISTVFRYLKNRNK